MTKCDFCDNEAIGYTIQQYFLYCEKHEKEAETRVNHILDYIDWWEKDDELNIENNNQFDEIEI